MDTTEPIEFLPDGMTRQFSKKQISAGHRYRSRCPAAIQGNSQIEGVSKSARSPLVYESGALTLQFTAQQRQLPLVEA